VRRPGSGPGFSRRVARLAAAAGVAAGVVGVVLSSGAPVNASGKGSAAGSTTTSNPWVPGTGGTITVGIDQAPTGCNPNTGSGDTWANRLVLEPVLPSAFNVDANGQATYDPALINQAELQSTNPETVVYDINPKAVWSDGKAVTASDFVYTWQQERETQGPVVLPGKGGATTGAALTAATPPATPLVPTTLPGATGTTGPAFGYRQIASMTQSAKGRTVTVVFKTPYADWQSLFDYLLPAHVLEKTGWNPTCSTVDPAIDLSAGPYVLDQVVPGKEVVLGRNPRWWEQEPPLQKIVIKIATSPGELARWLADGTVAVALPTGYDEHFLQAVTSQPAITTQSEQSSTFLQLEFSTTSTLTASGDVRLAVAHAIDRQTLVNNVVGWADSTIVPAVSHLYAQTQDGYPSHKPPPLQVSGQPGYTPTTLPSTSPTTPFPSTADLTATTRLLTASGAIRLGNGPWKFLTGKPLTLRMAVDVADPWASSAAANLVHQLGAAGITVTLVDAADAQAAGLDLTTNKADAALLPMHSSPYPSQAIAWYTPLLGAPGTGGSQDWSGFNDAAVNTLLVKASQELNPVTAAPLYTQVDTALWQQMIALPLFTEPSILGWSGTTAGVAPNPNGPSLLWETQNWAIRVPPASPKAQQ
jgi:peptide/nickel transport system substrate-binding protein